MRQRRPSLQRSYTTLDARLRSPATTRTLATVIGALLLVQGAVVLDRTGNTVGAPEITTLDAAEAAPTTRADDTDGATAAAAAAPLKVAGMEDVADATDLADSRSSDATGASTTAGTATADLTDAGTDATTGSTAPNQRSTSTRAGATPAQERFESRFPAQARAGQSTAEPATTRWAVLIGINEHSGRTRDNIGSRQDAEILAKHLGSLGWRDDHILLLTDGNATRENIVEAFRWLQRKTNEHSVVTVHYSGHVKQWPGRDVDGDGEVPDEALWPSDNNFITDGEVGDLLGRVRAARLWFNVGGCEAAGFNDWGTTGPDRIVTWSSAEHQKSYEDPSRENSVWGFFLVQAGMIWGHADANEDGNVTVEEAFRYATPRAHERTRGQSHGPQTPEVSDRFTGEFDLRIPPPPGRTQPSPSDDDDRPSCLLCGGTASVAARWR